MLHPDWYAVENPNPQGPGEEVYYVNRFTNQTTWDFPQRLLSLTESPHREFKSVYDKLTDVSLYTGTHKHRFDPETGRGLGREGRDAPIKDIGSPGLARAYGSPSKFKGNTNTGTDEVIHDISQVLIRR